MRYMIRMIMPRAGRLRPALSLWLLSIALLISTAAAVTGCAGNGTVSTRQPETVQVLTDATATVPQGAQAPSYTFAVCGDNRAEGIENGVFPRIIESARAKGAAFIVNTGDITGDGSLEELTLYRDVTSASGLGFYSVPGNHDVGSGGVSAAFENVIGPLYSSFDFGGDHFILLDNADDRVGIDAAQMQWFVADIAANAGRNHQFIFTHIPVADPSLPSGHVTGERGGRGCVRGSSSFRKPLNTLTSAASSSATYMPIFHTCLAAKGLSSPAGRARRCIFRRAPAAFIITCWSASVPIKSMSR